MRRVAPTLIVVGLLTATVTAFALAQRFKLERGPIARTRITELFAPTCGCRHATARIEFRLRRADRLTLAIVDGDGHVVRTLIDSARTRAGTVAATWDGRDRDGAVVGDGDYRPLVLLPRQGRSIVLPNRIEVDTTRPRVSILLLRPGRRFSPDGDGRRDRLVVDYRVSEPAAALLFVDGVRRVRTRFRASRGQLFWGGRVRGRALAPGSRRLMLRAVDRAGNVSRPVGLGTIRIRYVELAREVVRVRARTRFGVGVRTDARSYRWLFAGRTGTSSDRLLVLRAPRAGRYRLYVEANGHADVARVLVRRR